MHVKGPKKNNDDQTDQASLKPLNQISYDGHKNKRKEDNKKKKIKRQPKINEYRHKMKIKNTEGQKSIRFGAVCKLNPELSMRERIMMN